MSQSSIPESDHRGQQSAPVVSGHTPTPWFSCGWDRVEGEIQSRAGYTICTVWDRNGNPENKANAAFIVRAVNSHEALVKALEYALDLTDQEIAAGLGALTENGKKAYDACRVALASAREVKP